MLRDEIEISLFCVVILTMHKLKAALRAAGCILVKTLTHSVLYTITAAKKTELSHYKSLRNTVVIMVFTVSEAAMMKFIEIV